VLSRYNAPAGSNILNYDRDCIPTKHCATNIRERSRIESAVAVVALASGRIDVVNESTVELEQTEDDTLAAKVSDEALEAAAAGTMGGNYFYLLYPSNILSILLIGELPPSWRCSK
jgi:hypothetical protein